MDLGKWFHLFCQTKPRAEAAVGEEPTTQISRSVLTLPLTWPISRANTPSSSPLVSLMTSSSLSISSESKILAYSLSLLESLANISNLTSPKWTHDLPLTVIFPVPICQLWLLSFPRFHIQSVPKYYWFYIQNISRIWPLLTTSATATQAKAATISCQTTPVVSSLISLLWPCLLQSGLTTLTKAIPLDHAVPASHSFRAKVKG